MAIHPKIFIATSISNKIGKEGEIRRLRQIVGAIDVAVEKHGGTTRCAFREENWQEETAPDVYVSRDLNWCKDCDGAIVLAENSHGVRIEEGWLSAMKKPVLRLFDDAVGFQSGLEQHLGFITPVTDAIFHSLAEVETHVSEFVEKLTHTDIESREFAMQWRRHVQENGMAGSAVRMKLLNPKLKRLIGDIKGKKVLDIGCGEGFSTRLLTGEEAKQVVGVDVNPFLIQFALSDLNGTIFTVANMADLPFPNSSFDLILSYNLLMNANDDQIKKGVLEWYRVLGRYGKVVATIIHPIYSLFGNGVNSCVGEQIRRYGLNEDVRLDTIPGFEDFIDHRRPLSWYARAFSESGFCIRSFDEIFITEFEGMSDRHRKRIGLPIFAVFELEKAKIKYSSHNTV